MSNDEQLRVMSLLLVTGGVWPVRRVQEQPECVLRQWQVFELDNGERHLVGWCEADGEGRVSTAVAVLDADTRTCRTRSGRIYELRGSEGCNTDAGYVWNRWCRIHSVTSCRDVTPEVAALLAGRPGPC